MKALPEDFNEDPAAYLDDEGQAILREGLGLALEIMWRTAHDGVREGDVWHCPDDCMRCRLDHLHAHAEARDFIDLGDEAEEARALSPDSEKSQPSPDAVDSPAHLTGGHDGQAIHPDAGGSSPDVSHARVGEEGDRHRAPGGAQLGGSGPRAGRGACEPDGEGAGQEVVGGPDVGGDAERIEDLLCDFEGEVVKAHREAKGVGPDLSVWARRIAAALRTREPEGEDDDETARCTCQWIHPMDGSIDIWPAEMDPRCRVHTVAREPEERSERIEGWTRRGELAWFVKQKEEARSTSMEVWTYPQRGDDEPTDVTVILAGPAQGESR